MECNVCAEAFNKNERLPKVVVPCVHSACLKCLQEMDGKMCPTCGDPFLGDPVRLPNNYTVLQMLQNSVDMPDKTRGWCSECCALATPRCWEQHHVLAVGAALGQRVQDVLSQADAQLDGLKDRREEEQASQALTNLAALTGESWTLTLRGARRSLSVSLGDADDPVTKALLLLVAVRGELMEVPQKDADKEGSDSTTHVVDCKKKICSSARAVYKELISKMFGGAERLLMSGTDENLGVLQAAAPTLERLSVSLPTPAVLRAVHAMPRLRRLRVYGGSQDICKPDAPVGALAALPDAPATLQWLEVQSPRPALLRFLLPAHRLNLEVLRLESQGSARARMSCYHLFSLLEQCDFQALRRLELNDMMANTFDGDDETHRKEDCARQRDTLRPVLPAAAEVLCVQCDRSVRKWEYL
ncbi:uncharacterized protein LOC113206659 isoform X2 [Frankliniella occidentalis]|uniref:Uncharacterized protein LOC113206659 isoform X2 n=1 Tax=Frankliniella occidentalis TaxID=133901 RepID=A0A9C6X440_FRAOC|nr:uncharacterized protein LOC113206659 isoform X2 [Frankliniella occidentalis]